MNTNLSTDFFKHIPKVDNEPILDDTTMRQSLRIHSRLILATLMYQFKNKYLAARELIQNSIDATSSSIRVKARHRNGRMIVDFIDDGCGMCLDEVRNHYQTLFNSSKDNSPGMIGMFSVGRLSMFLLRPELVELLTLSSTVPEYGLRIRIQPDFSYEIYRVDREVAARLIGSPSGTLVRITLNAGTDEYLKIFRDMLTTIEAECSWVKPEISVYGPGENGKKRICRKINRRIEYPEGYGIRAVIPVKNGSETCEVECIILLKDPDKDIYGCVTFAKGYLPIQRSYSWDWYDRGRSFSFEKVSIIVNSFGYTSTISRDEIMQDEFECRARNAVMDLLVNEFTPMVCRTYMSGIKRYGDKLFKKYRRNMIEFLSDFLYESMMNGFTPPGDIYRVPFVENLLKPGRYLSIRDLDRAKKIYCTTRMMEEGELGTGKATEGTVCISSYNAASPSNFKTYLEKRYGSRFGSLAGRYLVKRKNDTLDLECEIDDWLNNHFADGEIWSMSVGDIMDARAACLAHTFSLCELGTPDGTSVSDTATILDGDIILVNMSCPLIRTLVEAMTGGLSADYRQMASHLFIREILMTPGLGYGPADVETAMDGDLRARFIGFSDRTKKFGT